MTNWAANLSTHGRVWLANPLQSEQIGESNACVESVAVERAGLRLVEFSRHRRAVACTWLRGRRRAAGLARVPHRTSAAPGVDSGALRRTARSRRPVTSRGRHDRIER